MNTRLSLVSMAVLVIAGLLLVIPISASQPGGGFTIGSLSPTPGQAVSGYPVPVDGSCSSDAPVIIVFATKSPLFKNTTDTSLMKQGNVIQEKPVVAPGFDKPTNQLTPPKLSVPSIGAMTRTNQSPAIIKPMTTTASAIFPVSTSTGTPLLKANMFAADQSSLPKIPFPPLNSVPARTETQAAPDYVTNSTRTIEQRIFYYTNIERSKAGKLPYIYDSRLSDIGREDAVDMIVRNFFDHINPDGESPSDRAERHGYPTKKDYGSYYRIGVGENIAWVQHIQGTPDDIAQYIVNAWMNSPDHRENILDLNGADYTNLGVGVAYDPVNDKYIAVQEFF